MSVDNLKNTFLSKRAPVTGVLCIDVASEISAKFGENIHSFIAASYVKFLECAGARVVPIWIGREREYYESLMHKINGVLLPGGAVFICDTERGEQQLNPNLSNDCVRAAKYIFDIANEKNAAGDHFPIWGTCLGLQLIFTHATNNENIRQPCTPLTCAMPVHMVEDYRNSQLFETLPEHLVAPLQTQHFAAHNHRFCITPQQMEEHKLLDDWHILGTSKDLNGKEFVNIVEHRRYPYFGTQFHPERPAYEQLTESECKDSNQRLCIELTQFFSNVFVDACRRSQHHFDSIEDEQRHMIWNFPQTYTGKIPKVHWVVCYLFTRNANYPPNDKETERLQSENA